MNANESKVDPLAVIDRYIEVDEAPIPNGDTPTIAHDLRQARATMAELVEADKEYDDANLALQSFDSNGLDADEEAAVYDALCQRFDTARDRRAAALSRFAGGA